MRVPQEYVDRIVTGERGVLDLWKLMNISNDRFIRTTDSYHVSAIQKIFKKMYEKGDIYKGKYVPIIGIGKTFMKIFRNFFNLYRYEVITK